ncbi:MAG: metalloregulator ArsR/SmtB family transcription factor [Trueperaceae bacterium]
MVAIDKQEVPDKQRLAAGRQGEQLVAKLKALADPSRLRILEFMLKPRGECCARDDGVCGCDFESLLGLSQPTVSHHLKILVQAGFLAADKRGRWTYYELEPPAFVELSGYFRRFERPSGD